MAIFIKENELKAYIANWNDLNDYYHGEKSKEIPLSELKAIIKNIPKYEIDNNQLKGVIKAEDLKSYFFRTLFSGDPETRALNGALYQFFADSIDKFLEIEEGKR